MTDKKPTEAEIAEALRNFGNHRTPEGHGDSLAAALRDSWDRIAELEAALERAEKALQPFDMAHLSVLEGGDPMRDITPHDLRFASEVYHELPAPQLSPAPVESKPCEGIKKGLRCSPCVEAKRTCQREGIITPVDRTPEIIELPP